jgi:hypothetical protein
MSAEVDDTIVRPSKRIRESHSVNNVHALQCQVCHRTYDRIDHLNRHLDSRECGKRARTSSNVAKRSQIEMKDRFVVRSVQQLSTEGQCVPSLQERLLIGHAP